MDARNSYIFITFVITWWALVACSSGRPASEPAERVKPEAIQQALVESEKLFKDREDLEKLRAAVKALAAVRDPNIVITRSNGPSRNTATSLGKYSPNQDEGEEFLESGRDAGKIASRVDPNKPDGYFWYAANSASFRNAARHRRL
jgi:hypothetical protein